MTGVVEVRCPVGPRRLFAKLRLGQERARFLQPDNLIEFSCSDCSGNLSRTEGRALRVLHRYNVLGELVQTLAEPKGQASAPSD